ncbi:MAG: glycosyltransferase family 39 protein [bacterium]
MTARRRDALLFAGALALRLAHVAAVRGGPLFRYLFIDSAFYDDVGRRLAAGGGFPPGVFFMNVLYGAFLGGVYAVFGPGATGRLAALAIQCVAGAASVVLLARLGEALGRPREGVLAAVLLAVFGPAIFYDGALLTPSLLLLLTTAATLACVRCLARLDAGAAEEAPPLRDAALLGALTGLLVLGRASHALLLAGWIAVLLTRGRRGRIAAGVVVAVAAVVVLPVTVRNWRASGELVPVTANGGMALWAGNHEGATGIYTETDFLKNPVPDREAEDYRSEASRRAGRELTLAESSAFWTRATISRWAAHPAAAIGLALRKARLFFHATEAQTNLSYYFARDFSPPLEVLRLHLGWVLPFVLLGFVTESRRLIVPALPIAAALATCIVFYVSSEYRHPVVPCMLLFAAAGAFRARDAWRAGGAWRRVALAGGLALLLVGTNARDAFLDRLQSRRVDYLNFATLASDAGRLEEAESFARESVALDPSWSVSREKLAEILQRRGRPEEAGEEAKRAQELGGGATVIAPGLESALRLFRNGRFAEARDAFVAVSRAGVGERATALNDAGLCAMRLQRFADAESLFFAARAADSAYVSPVVHLGRLALARGDSVQAATWARRALTLEPGDARARRLLARATGAAPAVPLAGDTSEE